MSQINSTLAIAGGVLAGLGILLWALKKGGRWAAPVAAAAGVIVLSLGFIVPPGRGGSDAVVSIVEPANGARVDASKPVTLRVALESGSLATSPTDQSGGHIHLYMDGQLLAMPYTTETQIQMPPGVHRLRVEYVDPRHVPFNPSVEAIISVTAIGGPAEAAPA